MTREEFIKVLDKGGYSYTIEGDRVIVTHPGLVNLKSLQTLPQGIEFNNRGDVHLRSLQTLPQGIVFNNGGAVNLMSLQTLPQGIVFNNGGAVNLMSLTRGWFSGWQGNIGGIDFKRLLNKMISLGLFDKEK
jgi:hypothetical protein